VLYRDPLDQAETKPCALTRRGTRRIGTEESVEHPFGIGLRQACAAVRHVDSRVVAFAPDPDDDLTLLGRRGPSYFRKIRL
jgi:hypothetical protein